MKSFILGSQHSCSWISFEGWQNPDQCPWFWSLTMKLSGVTVVMPLPEIMAIITQITIFVNPDPKLVHLFPAMWESFKRKFYLEDWEETWKGEYYFMVSPKRSYLSHDFLSSILSAVACESIRFSFALRHGDVSSSWNVPSGVERRRNGCFCRLFLLWTWIFLQVKDTDRLSYQ